MDYKGELKTQVSLMLFLRDKERPLSMFGRVENGSIETFKSAHTENWNARSLDTNSSSFSSRALLKVDSNHKWKGYFSSRITNLEWNMPNVMVLNEECHGQNEQYKLEWIHCKDPSERLLLTK